MLANKNRYGNSIYKINIKKYKQNLNHRTEIGSSVIQNHFYSAGNALEKLQY